MISVIVCSIQPKWLADLKENIESNIGVEYQLIAVDNRLEKKGICQVYNEAANKAKYNILCFIHEDVLIHSSNWGQKLLNLLSDETIGLVGVSGTIYKSAFPATWPACDPSLYRINTIQHFKNQPDPVKSVINPSNRNYEEVVILDGVFLATKKSIFNTCSFDEKLFKGFHCYDLDYSLNVGRDYKIIVTYDILLEHFSEGSLNKNWLEDSIRLHKKWKEILPKQIGQISSELKEKSDFIACRSFLSQALALSGSKRMVLNYYSRLILFYRKYNHFSFTKVVFKNLLNFK